MRLEIFALVEDGRENKRQRAETCWKLRQPQGSLVILLAAPTFAATTSGNSWACAGTSRVAPRSAVQCKALSLPIVQNMQISYPRLPQTLFKSVSINANHMTMIPKIEWYVSLSVGCSQVSCLSGTRRKLTLTRHVILQHA